MQMIEQYAYQVGAGSQSQESKNGVISGAAAVYESRPISSSLGMWDAAKVKYNASPVRGKAFCTLPRHEQVEIVRKYVSREV